jgi:uncharacterized membrane protein
MLILASPAGAEQIDSFYTTIRIDNNGLIKVEERIYYDFSEQEKHGIYRDMPIAYRARGGNYKLKISNINVSDDVGHPYGFEVSYPSGNARIKIGDANLTVSGKKMYVIKYDIDRAINYFDDHDELYWNATGNSWSSPIKVALAKVILPDWTGSGGITKACYRGPAGSTEQCGASNIEDVEGKARSISFSDRDLIPGEGLTIVVGFPKNIVTRPPLWKRLQNTLSDNYIFFLPFLVLAIMLFLWRKKGRDPEGQGTIIAQYDSPDGTTPAEVGVILDETADNADISSEIIYLATKGYLKISKVETKGWFGKTDYELEKVKEFEGLPKFEDDLLKSIFDSKAKKKLSDLKDKFYKDLARIKDVLYSDLVEKKYFLKSPQKTRAIYNTIGIAIIAFSIFFGFVHDSFQIFTTFSVIVSGAIIMIFGHFMPARTLKGVNAKEYILGLKLYLGVAEKDRINFHNAPEKNPAQFEKFLAYAMVLGVEKEWAKQFEGIYKTAPSWYSDPNGADFNSLVLVNSLSNFSSTAKSTLASAPSSNASSGGSGFSGGFSGGGFGGGGGGSW